MQRSYRPNTGLSAITAFIASTGTLGMIISGELNPLMLLPGLGMFFGYYRVFRGLHPAPRHAIGALSVAALLSLGADALFITGDFFLAVAHMTIAFQAIKSFDLKEPWDYIQVYFMALMQLVITSELTHSIAVGVIFAVFLAALIIAIVISHFISEGAIRRVRLGRPLALISLTVFAVTAVFFVATPRPGAGFGWRKAMKGIKTVGFSDKVDFGSFGDVLLNPTVVMRVELSGPKQNWAGGPASPLYFRGGTLDFFDGVSWAYTVKRRISVVKTGELFIVNPKAYNAAPPDALGIQRIYAEPLDTDIVFGLGEIVAIESQGMYASQGRYAETNTEGESFLPAKKNRRIAYTAYSTTGEGLAVRNIERYLQLPSDMAGMQKMAELARKTTAGAKTDYDKAASLEKHLRTNYSYSLSTSPPPRGVTVLEDFLFGSKKGYCEHYSTVMALMLRTLEIPSRIVTGFYGGEANAYGDYVIIRQSNAHSWVEAVIGGGWRRFDPTPAIEAAEPSQAFLYFDSMKLRWYRYVVGFSSKDQRALFSRIIETFTKRPSFGDFKSPELVIGKGLVIYIVLFVAFSSLAYVIISRRKRGQGVETAYYVRFRNRLKKSGGRVGPHSTPKDVLKEALRLGYGDSALEFIRLYEDARFGGRRLGRDERKLLQRLASFRPLQLAGQPNSPTRGTKTHGV